MGTKAIWAACLTASWFLSWEGFFVARQFENYNNV